MLDSFDVMLYALVLAALLRDPVLQLSQQTAGLLGSITLIAAAVGGIVFGVVADRLGRKQALMGAVLI
jgi:MFS family permease